MNGTVDGYGRRLSLVATAPQKRELNQAQENRAQTILKKAAAKAVASVMRSLRPDGVDGRHFTEKLNEAVRKALVTESNRLIRAAKVPPSTHALLKKHEETKKRNRREITEMNKEARLERARLRREMVAYCKDEIALAKDLSGLDFDAVRLAKRELEIARKAEAKELRRIRQETRKEKGVLRAEFKAEKKRIRKEHLLLLRKNRSLEVEVGRNEVRRMTIKREIDAPYLDDPIPAVKVRADRPIAAPTKSGVYVVWDSDLRVAYVGQSTNIYNRLKSHQSEGRILKEGEIVGWALVEGIEKAHDSRLLLPEALMIGKLRPYRNFPGGNSERSATMTETGNWEWNDSDEASNDKDGGEATPPREPA